MVHAPWPQFVFISLRGSPHTNARDTRHRDRHTAHTAHTRAAPRARATASTEKSPKSSHFAKNKKGKRHAHERAPCGPHRNTVFTLITYQNSLTLSTHRIQKCSVCEIRNSSVEVYAVLLFSYLSHLRGRLAATQSTTLQLYSTLSAQRESRRCNLSLS